MFVINLYFYILAYSKFLIVGHNKKHALAELPPSPENRLISIEPGLWQYQHMIQHEVYHQQNNLETKVKHI